jgi:PAS domain S-box-containing protein
MNEHQASDRAARQILEGVINSIPVRVFWKDKNLVYLGCNAAFARDAGFSDPTDVVGKDDYQMSWRDNAERYRADDRHVIQNGCPRLLIEEPLPTPDGNRLLLTNKAPLYGPEGEVMGVLGTYMDITDRKRTHEAAVRLATAVEQSAEAVVITDAAGTILQVNPAFVRATGYTSAEAVGRNPRFLQSGQHDAEFYRQMWAVLSRGDVWRGRLVNRRKDGTLFEEDATISPVRDDAGRIVNYVAVKRDVSNETRLEQQLFRAQKMEAVGRLAGGIAHDFNNLLGVMTGYGDIVHRRLAGDDPLKGKVEQIIRAAERAAGLTRQLLAFSRKQVLQPKILDLNAVVSDMDKMLRRLIGEDVELVTLLDPHLGSVRADPGQIEQVIMNLAVNARDAMPDGGRLAVETRNFELDAEYAASHPPTHTGSYVMLSVTDTGSGMDAATQARIFEPFFTTKEVGKGTGLGLATVYGIVKQSEGYVWVSSEVGVGTAFEIYLPRIDEAAAQVRHQEPVPLMRGTETVLLAEDAASLRDLLYETLATNGYTVLVAGDGAEAVRIAEAHAGPIQIMVTDVIMPGQTGPKAVDLLALTRPEMKVLYISGYSDESVTRHGLTGPGRAFLNKPFAPEALLRMVRQTLDAD